MFMNACRVLSSMRQRGRWLGLLAVMASPTAGAFTQEIRALFVPDSAKPHKNEFVNKTPVSGYCADAPAECAHQNMFSIRLATKFRASGPIPAFNAPNRGATFKVPAGWRRLEVRNAQTQKPEYVEVRVTGIGSQYTLSDSAAKLVGVSDILLGHQKLWDSKSWVYAAEPCTYSGVGFYGPETYKFFWKTPSEAACRKIAQFRVPDMTYEYLDFAYELRTPNPLGMTSGLYTGDLTYRIGPGGDFDMGDVMLPDDNLLTLSFVLDVQHTLKVELPPGGNRIQLEPAGGWQNWLQQGRKPTRLFRDQRFFISASSPFKMTVECEEYYLGDCRLVERSLRRGALVKVFVSLPDGLTDISGQPVKRAYLSYLNTVQFVPGFYVDRSPGILHFEIAADYVEHMIVPGLAAHYEGNITVIWDSDI